MYFNFTELTPKAGGEYSEGLVSQPRYINPLISQTSQADADLTNLVYDGLFAYGGDGKVYPQLADRYEVSEDGKTYTIFLKQGVLWHDQESFTADDIVYTINSIQNPSYKSPLRQNWIGVSVEKKDDFTVEFRLTKEYFGFLDTLTVGILPKHIWEPVTSEKFLLSEYNLEPIGTGAYYFADLKKDSSGNILSYELRKNKDYYDRLAYIDKFTLYFYQDQESLLAAYQAKEINGIYNIRPEDIRTLSERKGSSVHRLELPRLFGAFWNVTKSVPLSDSAVRRALSHAVDRQSIVDQVLLGEGETLATPIASFMTGRSDEDWPDFNPEKAAKILDDAGWKPGDDGIRTKDGKRLTIELLVPDWPELEKTGGLLVEQYKHIGAELSVQSISSSEAQQKTLKDKDYQAILFGQAAYIHSDPYSFWHSSQKGEGGLNTAFFENKDMDAVLEALRTATSEEKQNEYYHKFEKLFLQENPALFLYTPYYLYLQDKNVKGLDTTAINNPAGRLSNAKNWYIYTKRKFK